MHTAQSHISKRRWRGARNVTQKAGGKGEKMKKNETKKANTAKGLQGLLSSSNSKRGGDSSSDSSGTTSDISGSDPDSSDSDSDSDSDSGKSDSDSGSRSDSGTDSSNGSDRDSNSSSSDTGSSSSEAAGIFTKGARVQYLKTPDSVPQEAKILLHHRRDDTYDVKIVSSGRIKECVQAGQLSTRRTMNAKDVRIGDNVEAFVRRKGRKKSQKQWVPAAVIDVSAAEKLVAVKFVFDPACNVRKTAELDEKLVRWPDTGSSKARGRLRWVSGTKVKAWRDGKNSSSGMWVAATLTRVRESEGTYDVQFSDTGIVEKRLKRKYIQLAESATSFDDAAAADTNNTLSMHRKDRMLHEGALVQYRELDGWVNATVTRVYSRRKRWRGREEGDGGRDSMLYAVRIESDKTIRSDVPISDLRVRSIFDKIADVFERRHEQRGNFGPTRDSGRLLRLALKLSHKIRVAQEQGVIDDLQGLFQAADRDADGCLSVDELQGFLRTLRLKRFPRKDCAHLITMFGVGGETETERESSVRSKGGASSRGGKSINTQNRGLQFKRSTLDLGFGAGAAPLLTWEGFLRLTGVYDVKNQGAARKQKIVRVAGKVRRFFQTLLDRKDSDGALHTFDDLDPSGEGTLSYSAFHYGLANMGLQLEADEVVLLFDQFDPEDEGYVDYKKFLRFCTLDEEGA